MIRFPWPFHKKIDLETPGWLFFWGALVGLFSGGVTVLYRTAVNWGNRWMLEGEEIAFPLNALHFFFPAIGGLVVGLFLYKYLKRKPGHGIPSVIHAVQTNKIRIPWKMAVPSVASVIVLTTGGSAGPEGPAAEIGAVFGSNTGKRFGARNKTLRALVGAGVAGAIAAVFSAPIGGVFFALEVIFQNYELTLIAPVVISAVVASLLTQFGFGYGPAIEVPHFSAAFQDFPFFVGLGVVIGLMAALFIRWLEASSQMFESLPLPLWVKPAIGGVGVGILGIFVPEVIGEGYWVLNSELAGGVLISTMVIILLGKLAATGLTLGSGAPGGSFAPAIFIGGALGGVYGGFVEMLAPHWTENPASYALMGMAGMIAGTFNAPMTAIMITLRVTEGNYSVLLPLMTTVAVVHFVMSRWDNVSVYTQILKRHGQWFPSDYEKDPLLQLSVGDILVSPATRFAESMSVEHAMEEIIDSDETIFIVDDSEGRFKGILTLNDLRLTLADPVMGRLITLGDVLDESIPRVSTSTSLREAIHEFTTTKLEALPVFDSEGTFLGLVTRDGVLTAYRKAKKELG